MSLSTDLMGVGIGAEPAIRLGTSALTTIAGVGTAQGGAPIPQLTNNVFATTSVGQTALTLPANAEIDVPYWVYNSTATAALIFPPVGGAINAAGANASVSIAVSLSRVFYRKNATLWVSFLAA